jgi:hypothetical protein
MPRWIWFLIAVGLGIAAGLYYGWVLNPVSYVDTTPDSLRADYQADYVLMTAEAFHSTQDPAAAARELAILGSRPPAILVQQALVYASTHGFAAGDISLLQELGFAMQTYQPGALSPAESQTPGAPGP